MNIGLLTTALGGLVALGVALTHGYGWWVNRIRKNERAEIYSTLNDTFVFEIASNHLPHIYDALKLIAAKFEVKLPEPPPIRYMPFDPNEKMK